MASGLILIALGEATKMIPFLELKNEITKEYLFSIKWGIKTDTDDITGKIIEEGGIAPKNSEITAVLQNFPKEYDQTPPIFSAKKIGGVPAYALARKGSEVILTPKKVRIYELKKCRPQDTHYPAAARHPKDFAQYPNTVFSVICSKGTYVRSLVQDIAEKLGTIATCSMIRRIQTNGFHIKDAVKLDFLENLGNTAAVVSNYLKPLDFGLADIPVTKLETNDAALFSNGGFVQTQSLDGFIRVYSENRFIGIGMVEQGVLKPKRIINV